MASASEQVLNWIGGAICPPKQAPLKLSKNIESFESDFANGYLFGEILSNYGICDHIDAFQKKNNKEAKVQNFYMIEDALRNLKVKFDAKLIHQIMNEERGASMRLLYLIKLALDKHFSEDDTTVTGLKQAVVDQKVKHVSDLAVKLPKIHKEFGVEGPSFKLSHKPLKIVEEKLLKFELARTNLEKKAQNDDLAEKNMLHSIQQTKRAESIRKLHENRQFMKDWEEQGKKNWKVNRETRAEEIARQLYFEEREIKIYKDGLNAKLNFNTEDMIQGIEFFHENMQKLGIEQNISIQDAIKRQYEKRGIPPGQIQNFSFAATMNKIKETKNNNEFAGKERERRNRKMLVDQRKIQEKLDTQKSEENLIRRLLQQQNIEQKQAYSRWRNQECKNIVIYNQKQKANQMDEQQQKRNIKIDEEAKKLNEDVKEERQQLHEKNIEIYRQQNRAKKQKKRALNIEIASEIIDLIMDVSEEAFNILEEQQKTQQNQNEDDELKLIKKEKWRHWMDIFSNGKKVSEENLVINEDQVSAQQKWGRIDQMMQMLIGTSTGYISPYNLQNQIKKEPVFEDFLQYVSMCGPFNLRLVAADKWHSFKLIFQKDKSLQQMKNLDINFLNQLFSPTNEELGRFINRLYCETNEEQPFSFQGRTLYTTGNSTMMIQDEQQKEVQTQPLQLKFSNVLNDLQTDFPYYHPIKLCIIGRALSGKKSIAQSITKKLGDKIKIFDMKEILREAFMYISPNQQKEEVVDPKAKGGKGGKPTETVVDVFAGKDTTKYKDIAKQLQRQLQLTTGNEETLPGKDVDLLLLLNDDTLLVSLFLQKLKLTYPSQGPTQEEKELILKEKIAKEKEILDQLDEAKHNESQELDPKQKGKVKASKSPQDLQDELDQLLSIEKYGWILVDFPRTLNQAKLLEFAFSKYQSVSDSDKNQKHQNFETWSKLTDPDSNELINMDTNIKAQMSLFDNIFMINTSLDESTRRAVGRKIDPNTNTIYHIEDSPFEGDAKGQEKLVDYFGDCSNKNDMLQKIELNHGEFNDNDSSLQDFLKGFGQYDQQSGKGLQSFVLLNSLQKGNTKQEMKKQVEQTINQLLQFKQIDQDRRYIQLKQKIEQETLEKIVNDELEKVGNNERASQHKSQAPSIHNESVHEPEQQNLQIKQIPKNTLSASKTSLHSKNSHQVTGSKHSTHGQSRKTKRITYTRETKIKIWEDMVLSYIKEGMLIINDIKKQKETVTNGLNESQRQFIQFLERPCKKQEKVNEFINSFNLFSIEFPDLRKDEQTKEELNNRADKLSNDLWEIIDNRIKENIQKIKNMSQGGWSDQEMRNLIRNIASLIEIELKKFQVVYQITMQSESSVELDAEILSKKLLDRGVQPFDGNQCSSPVLEQVFISLITKTNEMIYLNPEVLQIINDTQGKILINERNILIYKLALVNSWALAMLQEIYINSRQVYDRMDDQIVISVAQESLIVQQVVQTIKKAIQEENLRIEEYKVQLETLDLFSRIELIHFRSDEIPLYLQNVHVPLDQVDTTRFTTDQLSYIYKYIRSNLGSFGNPNIFDQFSFLNMLVIIIRQGKCPLSWKYLNFDKISQIAKKFEIMPLVGPNDDRNESPKMYQSKLSNVNRSQGQNSRQWIDWKIALTFFSLLNSPFPSEKELADLRVRLTEAGENQCIQKNKFQQIEFWFDAYEGKADQALESKWLREKQERNDLSEYESEDDDGEDSFNWRRQNLNLRFY